MPRLRTRFIAKPVCSGDPVPERQDLSVARKLFTTLGDNIHTLAVDGDFDQCQALVKEVFNDRDLVGRLNINSANSINISGYLPRFVITSKLWRS